MFASTKTVFSEIGARQVEQLTLRITSVENQKLLIEKVKRILILNEEFLGLRRQFMNRVNSTFKPTKLTKKLENFSSMQFNTFLLEIQKISDIKLSLKDKMNGKNISMRKKSVYKI